VLAFRHAGWTPAAEDLALPGGGLVQQAPPARPSMAPLEQRSAGRLSCRVWSPGANFAPVVTRAERGNIHLPIRVRKHGASLWLQRRPRGLRALTDRLLTAYAHPANPPNVQEKERPEADPRIGIHPDCRDSPGAISDLRVTSGNSTHRWRAQRWRLFWCSSAAAALLQASME